jgi:rod shape-determining protein MreC
VNDHWDRRLRTVLIVLIVISVLLVTLTFKAGSTGVLAGARRGILAITTPFSRALTWVASPFVGAWRFIGSLGSLSRRNAELTTQNSVLTQKLIHSRELEVENAILRRLAGMKPQPPGKTGVATVVGYVPGGWERGLLLDLGAAQHVRVGAPVVVPEGLVGQIVRVGPIGSEVRLITDPRSGVGAMVQETRDNGIVEGSVTGGLYLRYIDRSSMVKKGDTAITSGLGGVYPKGLGIGTVASVSDPGFGLYKDIGIRSTVDFGHLEKVVVLIDYPRPLPASK